MEPRGAFRHPVPIMTELELELELAALRKRRQTSGFMVWLRSHRPFDRRTIREPDERDDYWIRVQQRLAESDASFLTRFDPYGTPTEPTPAFE
jgi:hypothetical protein